MFSKVFKVGSLLLLSQKLSVLTVRKIHPISISSIDMAVCPCNALIYIVTVEKIRNSPCARSFTNGAIMLFLVKKEKKKKNTLPWAKVGIW